MSKECANAIIKFMKDTVEYENCSSIDERTFDFFYEERIYPVSEKKIKTGVDLENFQKNEPYNIEELENSLNFLNREKFINRIGIAQTNFKIHFTENGWDYAQSI